MIITEECKCKNKIELLIDLVRADEALATLTEREYDFEEESGITIETLEYQGIKCELNYDQYGHTDTGETVFDELGCLINEIAKEIKNNDLEIHYNVKYGYIVF